MDLEHSFGPSIGQRRNLPSGNPQVSNICFTIKKKDLENKKVTRTVVIKSPNFYCFYRILDFYILCETWFGLSILTFWARLGLDWVFKTMTQPGMLSLSDSVTYRAKSTHPIKSMQMRMSFWAVITCHSYYNFYLLRIQCWQRNLSNTILNELWPESSWLHHDSVDLALLAITQLTRLDIGKTPSTL